MEFSSLSDSLVRILALVWMQSTGGIPLRHGLQGLGVCPSWSYSTSQLSWVQLSIVFLTIWIGNIVFAVVLLFHTQVVLIGDYKRPREDNFDLNHKYKISNNDSIFSRRILVIIILRGRISISILNSEAQSSLKNHHN